MNNSSLNIFQLASRRLHWLSARQSVISENIANADTAGFKAREVQSFDSYLDKAARKNALPVPEILEQADSWSSTLSGNNVVLEEQTIKATDTAAQYRMATNLYRKAYQMLLAAAGGR